MSYTAADLLARFRSDMQDTEEPYLWTDEEIFGYLNEAQMEFARATDILRGMATIAVTAGEAQVDLAAAHYKIRRARLASNQRPLGLTNFNELDDAQYANDYGTVLQSGWETVTGQPGVLVTDEESGKLRLVPEPVADDTLTVWTYRTPLTEIEDDLSDLEVTDARHQRTMLLYARSLGYQKHDSETYNDKLSLGLRQQFYAEADTFKARDAQSRRKPGVTAYGGL